MNATLELPVDLIEYIKAEAARHRQTVDALLRDALAREGEGTFESAFDNVEAIKQHMSQTYGRLPDSVDSIQEDRDRMLAERRALFEQVTTNRQAMYEETGLQPDCVPMIREDRDR